MMTYLSNMAVGKHKKRIAISLDKRICDILDTLATGGVSKSQLIESAVIFYTNQMLNIKKEIKPLQDDKKNVK